MKTEYDFAFSFAGEDRQVVESIKKELHGFKIFYDEDYQGELCGKDLYQYLRELYTNQAKYVVCFLSKSYKEKVWTNVEFTAIKERLMSTFFASDFLIPIVLENDVVLKDIPSFIGFYKYRNVSDTVSLLKSKYEQCLNEDFYLENINHFREYLLQDIVHCLNLKGVKTEHDENSITLFNVTYNKKISILPETFSKLPCLLLYENEAIETPFAIITWKRKENILFTLIFFTTLSNNRFEDISFKELALKIEHYLLSIEEIPYEN